MLDTHEAVLLKIENKKYKTCSKGARGAKMRKEWMQTVRGSDAFYNEYVFRFY